MTSTSAYVSTVNTDRTIELPESIPVGAKVAVIVLPSEETEYETASRSLRFQKVLDAIRAAVDNDFEPPEIYDPELNRLIVEARQAGKA